MDGNVKLPARAVELVGLGGHALGQGRLHTAHAMLDIRTHSQAQRNDIAAIGQALDQLDQVTQQNAALVEQSVSATAQLRTQADELTALVSRFILPESMPGTLLALQQ